MNIKSFAKISAMLALFIGVCYSQESIDSAQTNSGNEKLKEITQAPDEPVYCQKANEYSTQRKALSCVDSIMSDVKLKQKIDSLFNLSTNERYVNKFTCKPPVFFGAVFKTIPYPYALINKIIRNCPDYCNIFKYIKEFQIISANDEIPACQTAYAVIGAAFVKSWFIVNVDSICTDQNGRWGMYYSKNHFPTLNQVWEKQKRSSFTYLAREINIRFYTKPIDDKNTRVGIILALDSKSSVPGWVFRLIGKWIFPRFMKDLEIALQ